ncbi:MAG: PQQ-like beta-propeller repeat protein, partial [Planctomycetes bacterium]|nr:PQQ-like beta-propeller repeat protein [Planctomycetota bacterium]
PARLHAHGSHDNLQKVRQQEFAVLAINRRDGKILWQRTVHKELPHEGGHRTSSFASASPTTDGEHLFAFFGSRGLYCLDFDGQPIWQKNLGEMHTKHAHGEGSSPALHGDTLIVNWDHEGKSFVVALDKHNGNERWRAARDEVSSWATPIVVVHNQKPQVIVSGTKYIRSYDLQTGKVIWQCSGLSANVVASPVAAHGIVIAASSYVKRAILAIQLDGAAGDISGTDQIVWTRKQGTPYVPSLLLVDDSIYYLRHYQGLLTRVNVRTGQDQGAPFRLAGIYNVYASPVAAANRIYITDLDGTTLVITHDKNNPPQILAQNTLDDRFSASAAIVGQELFLRGENHLYCIATQ